MMYTFVIQNYCQKIRYVGYIMLEQIVDDTLGFNKLWVRSGTAKKGCEIKNMVNNFKYLYESQWLNYINRNDDHNKFRTYNKLKRDFEMEMYLQGIPDHRIRKNLIKIRTSTDSFVIEMGRYKQKSGKYIPASDRLCIFCKGNLVKDEKHVVMVCDNYNDSQKEMLERVSLIFPDFNRKNEDKKSSLL